MKKKKHICSNLFFNFYLKNNAFWSSHNNKIWLTGSCQISLWTSRTLDVGGAMVVEYCSFSESEKRIMDDINKEKEKENFKNNL